MVSSGPYTLGTHGGLEPTRRVVFPGLRCLKQGRKRRKGNERRKDRRKKKIKETFL